MRSHIVVALLAYLAPVGIAAAQEAPPAGGQTGPAPQSGAPPQAGNELPQVEVKTPTKPKKAAPKAAKEKSGAENDGQLAGASAAKTPSQAPSGPSTAATPGSSDLLPPPGTLINPLTTFLPTTVTKAREFEATHGDTLTDTLQNKPGISGSTFAPGANRPIIRGLDNNRVRIQENGVTTGDVSDISEDHAIPIDPNSVDQVEVIRGPATLRYGSQAIGGVVSAENQRIPTFMPEHGATGKVNGGLSSVDDDRDGAINVTAGAGGFVAHADAFGRRADDYDTPLGIQQNSSVDSHGASGGGSYVWSNGFAGVAYIRFDSLYAIPGIESAEVKSRIDMTQDKIAARSEWRAGDYGLAGLRTWFGYSDYAHNELDFDAAEGHDTVGSRFTNKQFEGRIEAESVPLATAFGPLRSTAGIQIGNRRLIGLSFEGDNLLEPNTTDSVGGYLFEELQLSRDLRVQAAGRIEHDEVDGSTFDNFTAPTGLVAHDLSFDPASASLGMLYDLPAGIVVSLTGQAVQRAPVAQELFSKGAHDATGTFEIGNPDIGIETADTIELGFKRASSAFRFDTAAYYTKFNGYIFRQLTGVKCAAELSTCGDADPTNDELDQVKFGQLDATFYGVELAGEYDVAPIWNGLWGVSGQYDFVRAQFDNGENVPRMPPHRLGGGLYYRDRAWQAGFGALYAFEQDETAPNETPTPGYTLLTAEASYTFELATVGGFAPRLLVGLKGQNLLDDEVRNSASFKKDEVLLPGADVRVFGNLQF